MYSYSEAIEVLIKRFPKLAVIYNNKENLDYYEGLPYLFYESEFTPYIVKKIRERDKLELKKIFDFVEEMLTNSDDKFVNLIGVAIIESLYYENEFAKFRDFISEFWGKTTKNDFDEHFIKPAI
ncbi:MAG: hypothetical protein FWC89_12690 [Defluviitaleaceae bacterium]|nr:hypothetical protein [Defluviitaleaceae bacterium]